MTMPLEIERKCAVCGATSEYTILFSSFSYACPDLDLRPSEKHRSTMNMWVHECPKCGYVSGDVSKPTNIAREWLQSEKYLTCDGMPFVSDLAKRFYRQYLLNSRREELRDAFYAILHAAWACDDAKDDENAKHCRQIGIVLGRLLIEEGCEDVDKIKLICADMMRRAGKFDQLISTYESVQFDDDLSNQILEFQIEKAKARDVSCYRIDDVTGAGRR